MNRIALIDNATLTAAQRLLGDIKVKNLYNIDGDIAAFENLLQAILFFDEIACIDDYKEEFRDSRHRKFSFVRFVPKEHVSYSSSMKRAQNTTKGILFRVAGHEIDEEEFKSFFQMLNTHLVFNWRMSASVFYLTVNLLAEEGGISVDKYSSLHAMVVSQLWGEEPEPSINLEIPVKDKNGRKLPPSFTREKDYAVGGQVQSFAAALNWLSLKAAFYAQIAEAQKMDLILHPIRHAFLVNLLKREYQLPSSTYHAVTTVLREGMTGAVRQILKASDPILSELNLPMWTAYLATRTGDPSKFLDECLQLRQEGVFAEARSQLAELQQLSENREVGEYVSSVNKLNLSLSKAAGRMLSKYGVSGRQELAVSPVLNMIVKAKTGHTIPAGLGKVPIPQALVGLTDRWGFRGVVRSVVSDLVSIERLGALHDIITSKVRRGSKEKFAMPQENPLWLGRNSSWKRYL